MEIDAALKKILGARRFRTDVERVLFAWPPTGHRPGLQAVAAEWPAATR
ncbi:hypothetical protein [Streptomyces tirandamycinicus]|nr:hypothetical protein [Streptomyces tirandamycinicus]